MPRRPRVDGYQARGWSEDMGFARRLEELDARLTRRVKREG
jgi:hypothetical protein